MVNQNRQVLDCPKTEEHGTLGSPDDGVSSKCTSHTQGAQADVRLGLSHHGDFLAGTLALTSIACPCMLDLTSAGTGSQLIARRPCSEMACRPQRSMRGDSTGRIWFCLDPGQS